jgi:hypothetical protein
MKKDTYFTLNAFLFHSVSLIQEGLRKYSLYSNRVQIKAGERDSSLLQNVQTNSGVHLSSYSMGIGNSLPGGQAVRA